ncbi:hypothetical protein PPL_09815 [Heterostelium album PN500]|uniref:Ankyrin repeat-containing protein n=1 Tax=Heterostelium pallidum (strain ATCC 26659 / Pp 5 / PN500) TaxID=670386 RepID=D3BP52_HETP5|nr:hypothetical protein PPL_09815 [Heterostelium album PN500]EFA77062.1 hypothetical protein PPL_09815 [Heterostelium album PN500]|eukprot:XP_020429191.1 hypothetical protein PPL_09815 [Heterostelium album PN500]
MIQSIRGQILEKIIMSTIDNSFHLVFSNKYLSKLIFDVIRASASKFKQTEFDLQEIENRILKRFNYTSVSNKRISTSNLIIDNNINSNNNSSSSSISSSLFSNNIIENNSSSNSSIEKTIEEDLLAMTNAASRGDVQTIKFLFDHRTERNDTALYTAAAHGHLNVVEFLLDNYYSTTTEHQENQHQHQQQQNIFFDYTNHKAMGGQSDLTDIRTGVVSWLSGGCQVHP